ncbi:ComEC/Rec2 family competence protein [Spiroplasma cantharicola]|nr:MBL fold metallo-hydrolase [Spiroplasma cantharicola]
MLNVGNGNSFLFQYKGKNILFDAGKGNGFNKKSLQQYLLYNGVRKIDALFISHNHKDHYDQIDDLKAIYNIKNIFYNYDNQFIFTIRDLKISNFIELENKDENDNSQVSLLEVKGKKILFTGDISKKRESRLLQNKDFLTKINGGIDLLQVAHHGSKTSSSQSFIKTIKPRNCFISGHKSKIYDFPSQDTIKTLKKYQCKTYITNAKNSYKYKVKSNRVIKVQKNFF